jgi:hypothetical protein
MLVLSDESISSPLPDLDLNWHYDFGDESGSAAGLWLTPYL